MLLPLLLVTCLLPAANAASFSASAAAAAHASGLVMSAAMPGPFCTQLPPSLLISNVFCTCQLCISSCTCMVHLRQNAPTTQCQPVIKLLV
jgi:hypothetical protein